MPTVKISELPTKTIAGTDKVPVVDDGNTTTSRVTASAIANLMTDASNLTTGTVAIGRIPTGTSSSTVCIGNDARLTPKKFFWF